MDNDSSNSSDYDSKDEFNNSNNIERGERVWIVRLSMGEIVALQCALHKDGKQYIRGIAVCSGHAGSNFEQYENQLL